MSFYSDLCYNTDIPVPIGVDTASSHEDMLVGQQVRLSSSGDVYRRHRMTERRWRVPRRLVALG